jgi:hypothetical protein
VLSAIFLEITSVFPNPCIDNPQKSTKSPIYVDACGKLKKVWGKLLEWLGKIWGKPWGKLSKNWLTARPTIKFRMSGFPDILML